MLLLLLNRVSRVRLCATPKTAAQQAPPSLGFSRQEYWSGLPFPSSMYESEKRKWSRSVVSDSATPWTVAYQAPPSMGFSRQEYWSGVPLPSPWYLILSPNNESSTRGDNFKFAYSRFVISDSSKLLRVFFRMEQGSWWTKDPTDLFTWLWLALGVQGFRSTLIAWAGPRPLMELQWDISFYRSFWNIMCSDVW